MLKQRIITALILAPIAIACVFLLPPLQFSLFVGGFILIASWEWANLADLEGYARFVYAGIVLLLLVTVTFLPPVIVLGLGAIWWTVAFLLVIQYPRATHLWSSPMVRYLLGFFVLVPGFVSLNVLKAMPDSNFLILLLFLLIWGADIGAYFAGRAFGKRKLAPEVSPGKSWAGVYGGLVTAAAIAIAMALFNGDPSLLSWRGIVFLLGCCVIVLVSVLGDLTESMFKRARGVKDSSNLLPGHGGVLDRLDSLFAAGPVFALFVLLFGWPQQ